MTGPKSDRWLVRTAGVLIPAIGATLLVGARRGAAWPELRLLGVSSAAGLAGIDHWYHVFRLLISHPRVAPQTR